MRRIYLTYTAGVLLLAVGAALVYLPAGFVVAGVAAVCAALWVVDDGES